MQDKKLKLQNSLGKIINQQRRELSITIFNEKMSGRGQELLQEIWSDVEKGKKDIQLSTFWRIAEALFLKPSELLKLIEEDLGEDFFLIDDNDIDIV